MFRNSNPTMRSSVWDAAVGTGQMTLSGTLAKTGLLALVLMAAASFTWSTGNVVLAMVGLFGGLVLGIMTPFKPMWAPVTAPLYSVFQGLAVGWISGYYAASLADTQYKGAVPLAILGTIVVLLLMLGLYATRIIKVNQTFMAVVVASTLAIGITYLVTLFGGFLFPGLWQLPIYRSGPIGIGFSAFVIVVASLNLAIDFKVIEDGVQGRAPKFMEWYAGFGLLVTLVWIYLEILRLFAKLAGKR